ncbi:unnamed protein product [Paramecium pentaurelia]|uniref:Uncharacterized protein n=1 Tax=Paramecium pentaurelia TaxID=43138 RepID=A0A8S1TUV3_9CILI|nr:unnamed protein product [Paramecium pentaurelia]
MKETLLENEFKEPKVMIIHLNFIFFQVNKQICILERNSAVYKSYFQVEYYQYTLPQKKRYNSTRLSYLFQQRLRNFKINFQADQGFIKEFREYKKNHTPAPGVYSDQLLITEPGQSVEFNKNPQMINSFISIFQRDISHFQFPRMNDNSPDLQRTISRNKAYQRMKKLKQKKPNGEQKMTERMSTFYISNNNMGNKDKIYLQRLDYYRIIDSSNEIKKLEQPDALDNNWSKILQIQIINIQRAIWFKEIKRRQNQKVKIVNSCKRMKYQLQFEYYFNRKNKFLNQIYYAQEYSPSRLPQLKSFARIKQDEFMKLKQRKIELELKLKQKELETKQNQKQDQNIDQENTIFTQSQPQDSKKWKGVLKKSQMKEAERVKKEKKKKTLLSKFEQLTISLRVDNVQIKKKLLKKKSEVITFQKQKDNIKNEKMQWQTKIEKSNKRWKSGRINIIIQSVPEAEAKIKMKYQMD